MTRTIPPRSRRPMAALIFLAGLFLLGCHPYLLRSTSPTAGSPTETVTWTSALTPEPNTEVSSNLSPCQVYFIDVGEGDSELLVTPHGKTIMIDGGDSDSGSLAFLTAHQVDHIDLMIATHPHADHIGGLIDVLANMPVKVVATNGRTTDTYTYERFLDQVKNSGVDYEELSAGDQFTVDGVSFSVLEPKNEDAPPDLDNTSLVIMARCYRTNILLTGDMEADEEKELLAAYASSDLQAQILKVAHHGSNTSSTFDFILAVKPAVAIYSAGEGNPYHHPHPSVINRLLSYVPAVYGTDKNGTISVSISPDGYAVELEKK